LFRRRIPEHPRIVKLVGSVIDYTDRDQTPVLLIMEKLKRDLYTALKNRLEFSIRLFYKNKIIVLFFIIK